MKVRIYAAPVGQIPACAEDVSPANGAIDLPRYNVKLQWRTNDPNPLLPYGFHIYFGTQNPPPFLNSTFDTTFHVGQLLRNTLYYWQVIPFGVSDQTASGCAIWSFHVHNPPVISQFP